MNSRPFPGMPSFNAIGANEIEILGRVFPCYRWRLITGDVLPENAQTSPDYDEANRNLANPNAG